GTPQGGAWNRMGGCALRSPRLRRRRQVALRSKQEKDFKLRVSVREPPSPAQAGVFFGALLTPAGRGFAFKGLALLALPQSNLISDREGLFLRTCLRIVSRSLPQNICAPTKNVGTPNAPRRKASSAAAARTRSVSGSPSVAQNKSAARPISSANAIQTVS